MKMRRRTSNPLKLTLLILPWFLLLTGTADLKETTVTVEGLASRGDSDLAAACDRALKDALVKAVESSVGLRLESKTTVVKELLTDSSVVTKARGFIKRYEILEPCREDERGLVRVKVQAIVTDQFTTDVIPALMDKEKIVILLDERLDTAALEPKLLRPRLEQHIKDNGFNQVLAGWDASDEKLQTYIAQAHEGNIHAAMLLGLKAKASRVLFGSAQVSATEQITEKLVAVRLHVSLYLLNVSSGETVAVYTNADAPIKALGRTSTIAAASAFKELWLSSALEPFLAAAAPEGLKVITVTLNETPDFQRFQEFRREILKVKGVKEEVGAAAYSNQTAVMKIRVSCDIDSVAAALEAVPGLKVSAVSATSISLRYEPEPR